MKTIIAALVTTCLFSFNTLTAQPQIRIHLNAGYNLPLDELGGSFPDDLGKEPMKYFMGNRINLNSDIQYYLGKTRRLGLMFSLSYNGFSTGALRNAIRGINGVHDTGNSNSSLNFVTLGLGAAYRFFQFGVVNVFADMSITGSLFSGIYHVTYYSEPTISIEMKDAFRFGTEVGVGADFQLSKNFGAIIGIKYDKANMFGKEYSDLRVTNAYALDDKGYTDQFGIVHSDRNISFVRFYAGVSLFFNHLKNSN